MNQEGPIPMTEPLTAPNDPINETLARAERKMAQGDFFMARLILDSDALRANHTDQERLAAFAKRFQLDKWALGTAAAMVLTLFILAMLTLFH
jgi:hypothetical protein